MVRSTIKLVLKFQADLQNPRKKPNICWFLKNGIFQFWLKLWLFTVQQKQKWSITMCNKTTMYLGKVPGHWRYSVLSSGWSNQNFSGRKQLFLEKFIFYEDDQWPKLQFSSASKTFLLSNTKLVFTYCSINSLRIKVTYFV